MIEYLHRQFFLKGGIYLNNSTSKITAKGLSILLIFSFIATVIGFAVAYTENRNYRALTAKYDEAVEKVSDLEVSVSALMAATASSAVDSSHEYPAEDYTNEIIATEDDIYASQESHQSSENTTNSQASSGTYYVTQSGKKYHIASCSYLSKSKIPITMDRIRAEGYSPCSRCIK